MADVPTGTTTLKTDFMVSAGEPLIPLKAQLDFV